MMPTRRINDGSAINNEVAARTWALSLGSPRGPVWVDVKFTGLWRKTDLGSILPGAPKHEGWQTEGAYGTGV
jgi:hypothetical protein